MGIYQSIYELIQTYIYGGIELTGEMALTATTLSTCGAIFVLSLPFVLVWRVIRMLGG